MALVARCTWLVCPLMAAALAATLAHVRALNFLSCRLAALHAGLFLDGLGLHGLLAGLVGDSGLCAVLFSFHNCLFSGLE